MKASEAYKNKHGLHKKPPTQAPQKLNVDLNQIEESEEFLDTPQSETFHNSLSKKNPPRVTRKTNRNIMNDDPQPNKRFRTPTGKVSLNFRFFTFHTNGSTNPQKDIKDYKNSVY